MVNDAGRQQEADPRLAFAVVDRLRQYQAALQVPIADLTR